MPMQGLLAQGNPMFDMGIGLLSASGPSLQPTNLGQAIGQGVQFVSQRDRARMENDVMRQHMAQTKARSDAISKLPGLLNNPEADPEQLTGVLAEIAPDQLAGGLLGEMFPQQDRAEPASIREFRTLYPNLDPGSPEGREAYFAFQKQQNPGADLDQLVTMTNLELNRMKMIQEADRIQNEQRTREQQRAGAQLDINKNLKYIEEAAMLNDKLAPTFLAAGNLGVDLRSKGALLLSEAKDLFGADTTEARQIVEDFNRYKKLTSELIIQGMGRVAGEGMGTATNQRMQLLSDSMAGVGNTPGSNKLIFADSIEGLLDVAEIERLSVTDQKKYRDMLNTLRSPTANIPTGSSMPLPPGVQSIRRMD